MNTYPTLAPVTPLAPDAAVPASMYRRHWRIGVKSARGRRAGVSAKKVMGDGSSLLPHWHYQADGGGGGGEGAIAHLLHMYNGNLWAITHQRRASNMCPCLPHLLAPHIRRTDRAATREAEL